MVNTPGIENAQIVYPSKHALSISKSSACVFRNIVVSLPALTSGKSKPVTSMTTVSSKHEFEPTTVMDVLPITG